MHYPSLKKSKQIFPIRWLFIQISRSYVCTTIYHGQSFLLLWSGKNALIHFSLNDRGILNTTCTIFYFFALYFIYGYSLYKIITFILHFMFYCVFFPRKWLLIYYRCQLHTFLAPYEFNFLKIFNIFFPPRY